jgi:hypothetical protein
MSKMRLYYTRTRGKRPGPLPWLLAAEKLSMGLWFAWRNAFSAAIKPVLSDQALAAEAQLGVGKALSSAITPLFAAW